MDDVAELMGSLAVLLPDQTEVRLTGVASVGAQRRTLFLDLLRNGETTKAIAQIAGSALEATSVASEAAILRTAKRGGVIVPEIIATDSASGTIISEHIEGESIPRRILRLVEATPELGEKLVSDCGSSLAAIHRLPTNALRQADAPGDHNLADPSRYADELERSLDFLTAPHPTFRLGVRWLRRFAPTQALAPAVIHGDFRLGNLLVRETGISAVLDWELAHLGDPMEDLAWLCLRTWRFGADGAEVGGFGSLEALRGAYEKAGGQWRQEAFDWWTVARTLWWGLGLARQAQVFIEGAASSIVLAASGRRVVELEYDLLCLIKEDARASSRTKGIQS